MSQLGPYPRSKPLVGAMLMTQFNTFYHINEFPPNKVDLLIKMAEDGFKDFDSLNHVLGSISVLLFDVPAKQLLEVSSSKKSSTLGVVSLIYLLNNPQHRQQVRLILKSGQGVMILRIFGEVNLSWKKLPKFTTEINLFADWSSYQRFVLPIVKDNNLVASGGGTLFS